MSDGAFNATARAAIYEAGGGRCLGCGSAQITAQHRRARGMGGTSSVGIGHPANGLPLCGSGTTGCHGWTERNPAAATLVGWRLAVEHDPVATPFWTASGWRRWIEAEDDGCPLIAFVDESDLDRLADREAAVAAFRDWRRTQPKR